MSRYTTVNGTAFADADLERWADQAEAGFPGATFGPATPGRPVSVGQDARPLTIRLDAARRAKHRAHADAHHMSVSQLVRDLIDAL